jgi:hypothetical protein
MRSRGWRWKSGSPWSDFLPALMNLPHQSAVEMSWAMSLGPADNPLNRRSPMIIALTSFKLRKPITREQARSIFLSTAPTYRGVQGLFKKHYLLSEDGATAGGVYLWNSREEAEALYTEAWRAFVREKYGTDPTVTYFDSPVLVDNVAQQVLTDS